MAEQRNLLTGWEVHTVADMTEMPAEYWCAMYAPATAAHPKQCLFETNEGLTYDEAKAVASLAAAAPELLAICEQIVDEVGATEDLGTHIRAALVAVIAKAKGGVA